MPRLSDKDITKKVLDWNISKDREDMLKAKEYYLSKNDITKRLFYINTPKGQIEDVYRSNTRLSSSFFQLLVDQKVSYCLSKDIVLKDISTPFDINDEIDYTAEEASIKSIGWTHIYADKEGLIKLKTMESEEIIEINDGTIEKNLLYVIRIYELSDEKFAQLWDDTNKYIYKMDKDGIYKYQEESSHLDNGVSWGMIPFIPLYNNRNKTNDLMRIKCIIDAYDTVISDFANNFIDFQELILFVKNYNENVATETAAMELMEWLKKYKIISVRADGSLDIISKEVPYQARGEFLLILKKLIYSFGQGVDIDELKGTSLTNVVVKAYFALLDIKANKFIKQCKKYIKELLKFSNAYNKMKSQQTYDISKVEIVFNKSIIINEKEVIESIAAAGEFTSLETQVAKNPLVDNAKEELQKIEEENLQYNEPVVPGSGLDEA